MNPHSKDRTCGGSSGGDAAIVAARVAPGSVGADIGGSIRCPAAFNGVLGFKGTPARTTLHGFVLPSIYQFAPFYSIKATAGPFGRSVDDLTLFLRSWWDNPAMSEKDESVPFMPFDLKKY